DGVAGLDCTTGARSRCPTTISVLSAPGAASATGDDSSGARPASFAAAIRQRGPVMSIFERAKAVIRRWRDWPQCPPADAQGRRIRARENLRDCKPYSGHEAGAAG